MKLFGLLWAIALTTQAIAGQQQDTSSIPPVLRKSEPADSVVFRLPSKSSEPQAPATAAVPNTEVHLAPPSADPNRPVLRRPAREYPAEFEEDSGDYLEQRIGSWRQIDAQELLGEPARHRPAYADDKSVNGQILAFPDPTGRYKEVELDFDQATGLLRTLFVYPDSMTWEECRQAFGENVRSTQANKGRIFYSYIDRRLDVLVDPAGKVISLGMY